MTRPIQATIDLTALRHNLAIARRHAPHSKIAAVIKANGYGHGLMRAARAFASADAYAILELDYAVRLRDAGLVKRTVLLEGCFEAAEMHEVAAHGFVPAVHCFEQIELLDALPEGTRIDVLMKINTGMNRLGFAPEQAVRALAALRSHRAVAGITLMTHYACADDARGIAAQQAVFERVAGGSGLPRSSANSAAVLRYPEVHRDWVRPGIMLYGGSPFADRSAAALDLRPAMTLESRIIGVQQLAPGDIVGYGATWTAQRPARIGIVACGYADGYPRHAASGTPVLVDGLRTETIGRVSMDMLCVDLGAMPIAGVGSRVTLWGEGLPADDVAAAAGTVSYELFCALAPRVPVVEVG